MIPILVRASSPSFPPSLPPSLHPFPLHLLIQEQDLTSHLSSLYPCLPSFPLVAYTEMGESSLDSSPSSSSSSSGPVLGSPTMTGGAFNTLAGYIFGANEAKTNMAMTTPVEIRKEAHHRGGGEAYSMRFIVSSSYTTETAPRPVDSKVRLTTTPPRERLAAREFAGFATEGEVQRQLISLLSALDRDGVSVVDSASYRIFQYNPPYTLPWLRRNEILVEVKGNVPSSGSASSSSASSSSFTDVVESAATAMDEAVADQWAVRGDMELGEAGNDGGDDKDDVSPSDY